MLVKQWHTAIGDSNDGPYMNQILTFNDQMSFTGTKEK